MIWAEWATQAPPCASILDFLQSTSHLLLALQLKLLFSQHSLCPRLVTSSSFSKQPFFPVCRSSHALFPLLPSHFPSWGYQVSVTFSRKPSLTSSLLWCVPQDSVPLPVIALITLWWADWLLVWSHTRFKIQQGQGPCPASLFPCSQFLPPSRCLIKERLYGSWWSSSASSSSSSKFLKDIY